MVRNRTAPQAEKPDQGILHFSEEGIPLDENGNLLDPPLLLVGEIDRMNLLGVRKRRLLEMIEQKVLSAKKATPEQEAALIRSRRIQGKQITYKGVYLVEPATLDSAEKHRRSPSIRGN
jgi:hypothetical protein